MRRVELLTGWQGGPAHVEVEGDALMLDDGEEGDGVILKIETALDLPTKYPAELELGSGTLHLRTFEGVEARLRFYVAASAEQARELAEAILEEVGPA